MTVIEAALASGAGTAAAWQAAEDTDSLVVLIASMLLAFVALLILMRLRF